MTAAAPVAGPAVFAPAGTSRGTVVVLVGRGEHPAVYGRLGARLAFDGYTVVVPAGEEVQQAFADHPDGLRVLLGSDTGALEAWAHAVARPDAVDAVVLAGLPLGTDGAGGTDNTDSTGGTDSAGGPGSTDGPAPDDQLAELDLRTSCPVHRALLSDDPAFGWGRLTSRVDTPPERLPAAPTLLLHGEADRVAPLAPVRALAATGSSATLAVVGDGVHDVLNDRFHRSVAARLVLFFEEIGKEARVRDDAAGDATAPSGRGRARRAAPVHVSARLDYAVRALTELPDDPAVEPMRCETVARARGIPLNSLVNLMVDLRRAGLVRSRRGCEGGYWLARPAATITLAEAVRAVEGDLATVPATSPWTELAGAADDVLAHRTIAQLRVPPRDVPQDSPPPGDPHPDTPPPRDLPQETP